MNDAAESPLRLRPVAPGDEAFLFEVYASTRAEELAAWGWPATQQEMFLRLQFRAQQTGYAATFPQATAELVLRGDTPVGTLRVDRSPTLLHLVDIALLPAHRGAGIGGRILRDLQQEAAATGRLMTLRVSHGNPAARLYLRLGFQVAEDGDLQMRLEWRPPQPNGQSVRPPELTGKVPRAPESDARS